MEIKSNKHPSSCDNCGKVRILHDSESYATGETSQCWECCQMEPECDVCGEELEKDGRCLWCFGDPNIDAVRSTLQKMARENAELLAAIKDLQSWLP